MRAKRLGYLLIQSEPANPRKLDGKGHRYLYRLLKDSRDVRPIYIAGWTVVYELAQ
jgi:hypothetical protein